VLGPAVAPVAIVQLEVVEARDERAGWQEGRQGEGAVDVLDDNAVVANVAPQRDAFEVLQQAEAARRYGEAGQGEDEVVHDAGGHDTQPGARGQDVEGGGRQRNIRAPMCA
jgi:hypothetical protein